MPRRALRGEHDPEVAERRGMSTEGEEVDDAETMSGATLNEGNLDFLDEDEVDYDDED